MQKKNMPEVGDIITSPKFAFGYYEREDKKVVTIDGKTTSRPVTFPINEDERVVIAAKSGEVPPKEKTVELGAYDATRGKAKFVIEKAGMQGGGSGGHGLYDIYPDGWHVQARRLNDDGTYNPNGEVIQFYMSGFFTCMVIQFYMSGFFTCMVEQKDVQVVGKMQLRFV